MLWSTNEFCFICDQRITSKSDTLCKQCAPIILSLKTDQLSTSYNSYPPLTLHSTFQYYGPLHLHFIHSKYQGNLILYKQMIRASLSSYVQQQLYNIFSQYDYIIPIPFRIKHLKKRNFSSAYEIAYAYQKCFPMLTLKASYLTRVKPTSIQSNLTQEQRQHAQRNSMQAFHMEDKKVILIDDVVTTGATLLEASRACYQSGAKKVVAFSLMSAL